MIDLFGGLPHFVAAARTLSFRRAAQDLGVSPAAVSKAVLRLERELGVALFARTSRRVELTGEGQLYFERCREAVAQVAAGRALLEQARALPTGRVDVSAPFLLGAVVVRALAPAADRYPGLEVHLHVSDRKLALVDDHIDLAIRIGEVGDPSLVARRLGRPRWVTVASPGYLARHGAPTTVAALADHRCLVFATPAGRAAPWFFAGPSGRQAVRVAGPLRIDQGELLVEAARAGVGLAQVFDFMVAGDLAAGRLIAVLEPHASDGEPVHAVSRQGATRSPRIRGVLDLLSGELSRFLPGRAPSPREASTP